MRVDYPPATISGYLRIIRAGQPHGMSLRDALRYAFRRALMTGAEHVVQMDGDPFGAVGYTVARLGLDSRSLLWVAECRPDGTCVHHSGYCLRWDAEITRAWRSANRTVAAELQRAMQGGA